jgi:hypothetical protein
MRCKINFIFIHIGVHYPDYLPANIERLGKIFPTVKTYLLTNNEKLQKIKYSSAQVVSYKVKESHDQILLTMAKSVNFREGFWRYSLERILAFCEFQQQFELEHLLHIESDVIVLPTLPIDKFEKSETLVWSQYNSTLDVATLLYSPSIKTAKFLELELIDSLVRNRLHTDMSILSEIRRNNPQAVSTLPSLDSSNTEMINSKSDVNSASIIEISKNIEFFGGIFDPAALGVWLLGQNPENTHGVQKLHNRWIIDAGDSFIDPSHLNFKILNSGELQIISTKSATQVFNLHVHSKEMSLMNENWIGQLQKYVKMSENNAEISHFNLRLFTRLLALNFKRGTLIHFFATVPMVYALRMRFKD